MRILLILIIFIQLGALCSGWFVADFIRKKLQKTVRIIDDGFIYRFWRDPDVPIYMLVRFFNVTNPDRVLRGEKPVLQEVGPYVYQEKRANVIQEFSIDNSTVSYKTKTTYFFRPDYSMGTEEDVITTVNIPYIVMVEKASGLSSIEKYVMREVFSNNGERLFINKTVGELLFDGYHQPSVAEVSELRGEELLPNNTFGIFYKKNGTLSEVYEIYTGVGNTSLFGQTRSWNGRSELDYWDNETCNTISGSDGSVFSPWLTRETTLKIFSPDMCRSMYLVFEKDVRVTGIPGYRFVTPREVLASPEENPENECFCKGGEYGPCLKTGAMRLAPCRNGTPVVISWPHFYNGDEEYRNQSIGMQPHAELHDTFVILEPFTGLIRRGTKRFQINMELKPTRHFRDFRRVPNMLFPIAWIEESKLSRFRTRSYFRRNNYNYNTVMGLSSPLNFLGDETSSQESEESG